MGIDILYYAITGLIAGTLAGLLGIGGGVLVVPALAMIYTHLHFPHDITMHLAAGTSLAIMILNSPVAIMQHRRKADINWTIFYQLAPGLFSGVIIGVIIADILHTHVLRSFFGLFLIFIAIKVWQGSKAKEGLERRLPGRTGMGIAGGVIGANSGMLGVGGGSLAVPYLLRCHVPMGETVTISALVTFSVALVGTILAMITGSNEANLPAWSIGYVYWPAVFSVAVPSMIAAHLAAPWAHVLPAKLLKRFFAIFLLLVSVHMLSYVSF